MNAFNMDFSSYIPETWFFGGMLLKTKHRDQAKNKCETRESAWNVSLTKGTLGLGLISLVVGVNTLSSNEIAATNIEQVQAEWAPKAEKIIDPHASPLLTREINKPFNELFAMFRAGVPMISSDETRALAKAAVQKRDEPINIENWALALANDVRDAKD